VNVLDACDLLLDFLSKRKTIRAARAEAKVRSTSGNKDSFIGYNIFVGSDEFNLKYIHRYLKLPISCLEILVPLSSMSTLTKVACI
jgi:hypothetical protein